jgi:two-component system CheB/CheR fusion protein
VEQSFADYLIEVPVFVRAVDGEIVYWTKGAEHLYGYEWDEAVGRYPHERLRTQFPLPLDDIQAALLSDGFWAGLLGQTRKDGRQLWTESRWRLKGGTTGQMVVESNTDVTARETLTQELSHRVKNTVAVIQGLAHLSLKSSRQTEEFRGFENRLIAVAKAHDILVRHHWDFGDLGELVQGMLEAFHTSDRVSASGPPVRLRPGAVVAYSLALHELATNAIKYGALSVSKGHVDIVWSLAGDQADKLRLVWRESDGPPVQPPATAGFGRRLLETALSHELGGPVLLRFEPEGLICEINGDVQTAPDLPVA